MPKQAKGGYMQFDALTHYAAVLTPDGVKVAYRSRAKLQHRHCDLRVENSDNLNLSHVKKAWIITLFLYNKKSFESFL